MRRVLLASLLPVVAVAASCLGPTEVMVTITTNACGTLARTDIYIGSAKTPVTSTGGCADGNTVGTIAFVPSGSVDERLEIAIVGAVGGACADVDAPGAQCIVARRSLSFEPHKRLDLPIFLDSACANTPCGPDETCVADPNPHCKSKQCDADGGVVCESDAGGPDVSVDVTLDVLPDIALDGPATCPVVVLGQPTLSWSFDGLTDAVHEDNENTKPEPFTTGSIGKDPTFCGNYLQVSNGSQPLATGATKLGTKTFNVGFAYNTATDGTIVRIDSLNLNTGFSIGINQGQLVVDFQKVSNIEVYRDTNKTTDSAWHTALVEVVTAPVGDSGTSFSSTIRVTVDNVAGKVTPTSIAYPVSATQMSVGPIGAVDQISFFAF